MRKCHSLLILLLFWAQLIAESAKNSINDENNELYSSSITGLLKLLEMDQQFIENIKAYTNKMEEKVKNLQAYIESIDYGVRESLEEREKYVSNPLNAFSLVRRTHQDLPKWHNYSQQIVGLEELYALEEILSKGPDKKDMEYSLRNMQRLEKIYDLEATDLARGRLHNKQYDIKLSLRDCIALGEHKFHMEDYQRASMWFRMALKQEPEGNDTIINNILGDPKDKLYMQYAKSMIIFGIIQSNFSMTIKEVQAITNEALKESSLADLKSLISELLSQSDEEIVSEMNVNKTAPNDYELGCRGRFSRRRNLVCSYNFTTSPFLRLAPLKQEVLSMDPDIVIYHNVLYDEEILKLEQHAENNTALEINPVKERIFRRITDMTGFRFSLTDDLKLSDQKTSSLLNSHSKGTLIFYANDVEQGGATVFPKLKISVFPQKGSCLFWYNIFDNGNPDPRSEHLECPVLQGNKKVLTKWVYMEPKMCRPKMREKMDLGKF
ncbi:prolyl 4-hydroxylase subunit alpha-2 [Drosophila rhopaloa]|uniref:Prolyl 4-hydroxylase subunit alpha-2 n=1 Tax=Drosophila rhopaloa TaxID=1041015 RepID=A0A6P4EAI9_DRORH|nr:prolyl 4-hydroxylase subunit alpha-2 [Drosophila rhopaloa]